MIRIGESVIPVDDYKIVHKYSGIDELSFDIPAKDPVYKQLKEESVIYTDQAKFVIKSVSTGAETAEINAVLDLREFYSSFEMTFDSDSVTLTELMDAVLPDGWNFRDKSGSTIRRTLHLEKVTPMDKLDAARNTYGVLFLFDTESKTVTAFSQTPGDPVGAFVTEELNLEELNFFGKSESLITRMYVRGKDGLTFADINDGKDYVEDFTYTNKVICGVWEDDRYTVKENMLSDAKSKLAVLARPERSYSCSVINLAKTNPDMYGFQDFSLLNVVTLIDATHNERVDHQVVEVTEYPNYPERDEVVLSTVAPTIQSQVNSIKDEISNPNSDFNSALNAAISSATENIIGASGGYVVLDTDTAGKIYQILIMDQPTKDTATKVWRWNLGGLGYSSNGANGPFSTAITQDGAIVADFITAGGMNAARITAGILRSKTGDFTLDLDNSVISVRGESGFTIATGKFKIQSIINGVATDALSMQTVQNDEGGTDIVLRIEDGVELSDNFILPVENGGTGQSTLVGFPDKIGIFSSTEEPEQSSGTDGDLWRRFTPSGQTAEHAGAELTPMPEPGKYSLPGHESGAHNIGSYVDYWNVNQYKDGSAGDWCRVGANGSGTFFALYEEFTFPQASREVTSISFSVPMQRTIPGCGNINKWKGGIGFSLLELKDGVMSPVKQIIVPGGTTQASGWITLEFNNVSLHGGERLGVSATGFESYSMVWLNAKKFKLNGVTLGESFDMYLKSNGLWKNLALIAYPVGSIYVSANDVSPAVLFGGEWEKIEERFLISAGPDYPNGAMGGTSNHNHISPIGYNNSDKTISTLNIAGVTEFFDNYGGYNAVARDSGGSSIPGGYGAYLTMNESHMPPYLAVNMWKRTK